MHPMLKPALRRCWRDRNTMQFGVSPAHAVVLGPVDPATGSFLGLLDGTRGLPLLRREAAALGLPDSAVEALVERLAAAGLLDDPTAIPGPTVPPGPEWERLRPDLAALSLRHPAPGDAWRRMAARRETRVQVRGAGRVGAAVAAGLSAAGIGRVHVVDGGCVEPWDVSPSGMRVESVGQRRDAAGRRLVRASSPSRTGEREDPGDCAARTALVVHAPRDGLSALAPDPVPSEDLLASGTPHLYTGVIENTGIVGPLVLPGEAPCSGCLALEREAHEPGWSRMVAQWRSGRATAVHACDSALASVVAGVAVVHALAFLDGTLPSSVGARLELVPPDLAGDPQRISAHPSCPCGAWRTEPASGQRAGDRRAQGSTVPIAPRVPEAAV
ncbi:ThiF family adenylyltransferase [Streptomyces meridianus]|uniref:ThiF family adenylyltransferase n=1 Tax=Streptomyces meridianus TaxID=2938945 RepID=A0ABT0X3B3_9ACTN|nr:ThiF family adenylyltransferase [Streptomyces meridianus]MCM2576152.1 ThiF family adenylyltransferase [Streptomyces meridianus]